MLAAFLAAGCGDDIVARTGGAGADASTARDASQHKGAVNARAVLDWMYRAIPDPEKVFVTGCSAGAYASLIWSAHIRAHYDDQQYFYYKVGGGGDDVYEWSEAKRANVREAEDNTPGFRSFVSPGYHHCAIPYPRFYTESSDGVRLVDWLRELVEGDLPDSVTCDPDCGSPNPRDIP